MYLSEEKISEIVDKNDIIDVISEYMTLKRSGSNYMALCPFHSEKTPSFSVSASKQIYYCFGCGAGGNVVSFIQKIERLSYIEALRFLADRAKIEIEDKRDERAEERANQKKAMYKLNVEAARFFYKKLQENKTAQEYLKGRGLSSEIITRFGLGYAPSEWKELLFFLQKKGYSLDQLHKAGLVTKKEETNNYYDRFRNRVMFPIIDLKGNVIAFGGRVMDDSKPKYLNSPDTPIFNKGYNMYALNFVKQNTNLDNIIIVEGYMDVIALHQYGVTNAVASLGTAFTEHQAKLLKRFSNEIIIAYDTDLAGQNATTKGLHILEKEGCVVRILRLPSGKDPDEFIRKEGLKAFQEQLKKCTSLIEYKVDTIKSRLDINNLQDRITFTKEFSQILAEIESNVEVDAYIKKYAKIMQVNEQSVYDELNRLREKNKNGKNQHNILDDKKNVEETKTGEVVAEIYLLNACIYDSQKAKNIFESIEPADFTDELHMKIAQILILRKKEGKKATAGEIISYFENEEDKSRVADIFSYQLPDSMDEQFIQSTIEKVKQSKLNKRIQELQSKMDELFRNGDTENANKLFIEFQHLLELQKRKK